MEAWAAAPLFRQSFLKLRGTMEAFALSSDINESAENRLLFGEGIRVEVKGPLIL